MEKLQKEEELEDIENLTMEEKPEKTSKMKRIHDDEINNNIFLNDNEEEEPKEFLDYRNKSDSTLQQMIPFLNEKPSEKNVLLKKKEFKILKFDNIKEEQNLESIGNCRYTLIEANLDTFAIIEELLLWLVDIKYCKFLNEAKIKKKYSKPLSELLIKSAAQFEECIDKSLDFIFVSDTLVVHHQPNKNSTSIKFLLQSQDVHDSVFSWIFRKLERIKSLKRLLFNFKGSKNFSYLTMKGLHKLLSINRGLESLWLDFSGLILLNPTYQYIGKILNQNPNITRWALILDLCHTNFDQIEIISNSFLENIKVLKLSLNENKYLSKEGQRNLIDKISKMKSLVCFEFSIRKGYVFLSVFNYMIEIFRSLKTLTKFKVKLGVTYYKVLYLMFGQEKRAGLAAKCEMAELIAINSRLKTYAILASIAMKNKFKAFNVRKEIKNELLFDFIFEGLSKSIQDKEFRRRLGLSTGLKFLSHKEYF